MTNRNGSDVGIMPSFLRTLCLAVAVLFSAAGSHAADDTFDIAAMTTIRGTVRFEKRNTVVPYIENMAAVVVNSAMPATPVCSDDYCPRSNPYWAVIVDDGQHYYELHQPFAIGESRAPNFLEVNGVKIRPGFQVAVEGSIETISPNYGIISDVKSISVLSAAMRAVQERLESQYGVALAYGWNCASLDNPYNGLNAYVWYGRKKASDSFGFHLRVIAKTIYDLARLHQGVTDINYLEMKRVSNNIVYQGAVQDTAATLSIQRTYPQVSNYPSNLRISSIQGSLGVRMYCSPVVMPIAVGE